MDSRLFMEIGIIDDSFQAIDKTSYASWINSGVLDAEHTHVVVQRLVSMKDSENELIDSKTEQVSTVEEYQATWTIDSLNDGLYYYQKIILPTQGHTSAANEILWYDITTNKVMYYDEDASNEIAYDLLDNFDDIYTLVRTGADNCFYFDDYLFTIHNLTKCYFLMEKNRIESYLKNNCRNSCKDTSDQQSKIDLVLAAITVLQDLIDSDNYFEAQRILNGLSSCGNLCSDYTDTGIKPCGCGRT